MYWNIVKNTIGNKKLPKICDPSCGCGVFLIESAKQIAKASGISYKECLITNQREFILDIKKGKYDLTKAEDMANKYLYTIEVIADDFCNSISEESNKKIEELLDNIK